MHSHAKGVSGMALNVANAGNCGDFDPLTDVNKRRTLSYTQPHYCHRIWTIVCGNGLSELPEF